MITNLYSQNIIEGRNKAIAGNKAIIASLIISTIQKGVTP